MSQPDITRNGEGPRTGALRFRVGGIPVEVRPSLLLVLGLLGLQLGDVRAIAAWVIVGTLSILVHELGHAVVARFAGATPAIQLAGLGGVTTYRPTERSIRRGWRFAIAVAGPLTGVAVWLVAVQVRSALAPVDGLLALVLSVVEFTSLIWSLFNLLPIPPLDGGTALAQLLPGDHATRDRRAAFVGVAVGVLVVAGALYLNQSFVAIFIGFMTWGNVSTIRRKREIAVPADDPVRSGDWPGFVERVRAGEADTTTTIRVVREMAGAGAHAQAAEVAELALAHGYDDHRLAWQAARSWTAAGNHPRARAMIERAVVLGADRAEITADPTLTDLAD